MDSPFRLYSISLLIFHNHARFIRWDRSVAIVTRKFDYTKNPNLLAGFLWSVSHAPPDLLGIDPTVSEASNEEAQLAHHLLEVASERPVYKVTIPSRDDPSQSETYLLPTSYWKSSSPFGRGTRSTTAIRLRDHKLVFVKDYWRVEAEGSLSEGQIYRRLEDANVPHIATFDHGNDIVGHQTIGHLYSAKSWACKAAPLSLFQHYRMSLSTVGRNLTSFRSTLEYTQAIADAMKGRPTT
jgi:hypothetical protein